MDIEGLAKSAQSFFDKLTIRMYLKHLFSVSLRLVTYMVMLKYFDQNQSLAQLIALNLSIQVMKIGLNK